MTCKQWFLLDQIARLKHPKRIELQNALGAVLAADRVGTLDMKRFNTLYNSFKDEGDRDLFVEYIEEILAQ